MTPAAGPGVDSVPVGPRVFTDAQVYAALSPQAAVATMRATLVAHSEGRHIAPPRTHAQLGGGRLIITAGESPGRWFGYRSYDSLGRTPGEQVVVLHEAAGGRVRALAIGNALGPMRTGAIGAVAVDALANPDATSLSLVGAGRQAWMQLWAIASVRRLTSVRITSRTPDSRTALAHRARAELGLDAVPVPTAYDAVTGADIIVLATDSPTPVVAAEWVAPGAFVTTLGPKQVGRAEFDAALVDAADIAVTDSPAQIAAYDPPCILAGTAQADRFVSLGDVLTARAPGRSDPAQRVLFFSVGLAGTEVALLAHLAGA